MNQIQLSHGGGGEETNSLLESHLQIQIGKFVEKLLETKLQSP